MATPDNGAATMPGSDRATLVTPCVFNSTKKTMLVTVEGGELLILAKRASDNFLLVNGEVCGGATNTTVQYLQVVENAASPGDETVIIDLTGGVFVPGKTNSLPGISLSLGIGSDSVSVRGTTNADIVRMGLNGISVDKDNFRDIGITSTGTVSYSISLAGGNDTFVADGSFSGTGAAFAYDLTVLGGDGNDTLIGGAGNDDIHGGNGDDRIAGGLGNDTCAGDSGDDFFDESRPTLVSNGNDTYTDAGGSDTLDYSKRTSALFVDIEAPAGGSSDDGEIALSEADQVDTGIDVIRGGTAGDTLTGDGNANTLSGGAGDDTISGGGGQDSLSGDAGNDTFDEGSSANGGDTMGGGAGSDTVSYAARTGALVVTMDSLLANDGDALSSEGDNVMSDVENCLAGSGSDDLTGNTAGNVLTGGGGADTLRGDGGDDTFKEGSASNGGDTFVGGAGYDTVDYGDRGSALTVTLGTGADDGASGEHDDLTSDVEGCIGGSAADSLTGSTGDDNLSGGGGNDTIYGGAGNDALGGDDGDDRLYGEDGLDILDGGDQGAGDTLDCGLGDPDIGYNGEVISNCEL